MTERRRLERFELAAPARVIVVSDCCERTPLNLTTRNVSSGGAFLDCLQPVLEGSQVKMEFLLCLDTLWKRAGEKGKARIKVRGKIIRVDADGIAVRFESKYKIMAFENGNHRTGYF